MALLVDSKLDEIIQFLGGCGSGIIDVHSRLEALQQDLGVTRTELLGIITQEISQKVSALQKGNQESKASLLRAISEMSTMVKQLSEDAERSHSTRAGQMSKEIVDAKASIQSALTETSKQHDKALQQANSSLENIKSQQQSMLGRIVDKFGSLERLLNTQQTELTQQLESVRKTVKKCTGIVISLLVMAIVLLIMLVVHNQ